MAEAKAGIRKRLLEVEDTDDAVRVGIGQAGEIDLAQTAAVAYSSEDPGYPIENLIDGSIGPGATCWRGARADAEEHVVIEFDRPQSISRLVYEVEEAAADRTQEVRVEVSEDDGETYRQVLVQAYNFSPAGATFQHEDQRFTVDRATHLRLTVVPNKNGSGVATLTTVRLFA